MRLKFKATAKCNKQLSFFSIFDSDEQDEEEIIQIVEHPQDYLSEILAKDQENNPIIETPQSVLTEVSFEEIENPVVIPVSNKSKGSVLHMLNHAVETDYLYTLPEYDADLGGLVFDWSPNDVMLLYIAAMDESFETIKNLVFNKTLYAVDDNGLIKVNPVLDAETKWYMSEIFELACASNGLDAIEMRTQFKFMLYEETHNKFAIRKIKTQYQNDKEIVFHECREAMGWDIFFDQDYFIDSNELAIRWSDKDIYDIYKLAFKQTMDLFEDLVISNMLTTRDAKGWVIVNPKFEREFEWIMSDAFEIIGSHLGYDVSAVRKQMATMCNLAFN
ncbi:hypothetical protein FIP36_17155 [Salmonella enterica]|nr:hypothetical protein [Salmonella enterica]